jgi:RND family efflux transporter MFP subunit
MKRFWTVLGLAGGLLGIASVVAFAANDRLLFASDEVAPYKLTRELATPVRVHRVVASDAALRSYTGIVKPRFESDLGFRVAGKVVGRTVEVGDEVRAGQVILLLDPADYRLAVQVAEADVAAARAEASNAAKEEVRTQRLSVSGSASRSELDRVTDARTAADARVDRAERSLQLAMNRLCYTELKTEFDGVVTSLPVEVGQVVAEGTPVARVARTSELEAVINLPENRCDDARSAVRATIWGERGAVYDLTLRELSPTADAMTRTYQARYTIHRPDHHVTIGRTVTLFVGAEPTRPTVVVPLTAVRQEAGQPAVWRLDGDRLLSVPVVVASYRDDFAVIADGLLPGDVVVAAGVQKLDAGLRVRRWEGK